MDASESKLYWQCRRGMRELDLLLMGFLKAGYHQLEPNEKQAFEEVLDYPDALLLEYLMGRRLPSDTMNASVIERIRESATH